MIAWKTAGTKLYQELPAELFKSLKECDPLRKKKSTKKQAKVETYYQTLRKTLGK